MVKTRILAALISILVATATPHSTGAAVLLAPADEQAAKAALDSADAGRWAQARSQAEKIKDPVTRKLIRWMDYTRSDSGVTFAEISAFIKENPTWPETSALLRRAEEAISSSSMNPEQILGWFQAHHPVSMIGWTRYADALLAAGRTEMGRTVLRETWIDGNMSAAEEKSFYDKYRKHLTQADHIARTDRLLWEGRSDQAKRMIFKLPADYRLLAETRLQLMRKEGNVDRAIAKVPDSLKNDQGLLYDRIRWRRRTGKIPGAVELLAAADSQKYPQKWWVERAALARESLERGNITDAYRLASQHGLKDGAAYADAEWLAGWIALRFLNDLDVAVQHFTALHASVEFPVSRARGAYWVGRAEDARGNSEKARHWYALAAANPTTYYGQLASDAIYPGKGIDIPVDPHPSDAEVKAFEAHELVKAVRILSIAGKSKFIRPFVLRLSDLNDTPTWGAMSALLARSYGNLDLGITVAKRLNRSGATLIQAGYPLGDPWVKPSEPKSAKVELPLVLAVIRQESSFRPEAVSSAGAQG